MRRRMVLDASALAAVLNMDDPNHQAAYWYFYNLHDADAATWVVPGLIFFEIQAVRARRYRERIDAAQTYRNVPLYFENTELYEVTPEFLVKVHDQDLYSRFGSLKGADLLYACIARVERIPLVTFDKDFQRHSDLIDIIRPGDAADAT